MTFLETMKQQARTCRKTIVLPESYDPRVVEAAAKVLQEGFADVVLLGERAKIQAVAPMWSIEAATVINPADFADINDFVETFFELRKSKGITREEAVAAMQVPTAFGVMMVKKGMADGLVSGSIGSTADTIRPALQILKTKPGAKLVSSFFIMVVPECELGEQGLFLFSDCALVENPTSEQLAEIAIQSSVSFKALTQVEPKVAMLSYSTQGSAKNELVDKVATATALAKQSAPQLKLDGELQLDAAIVASVGKSKAPKSAIQGDANCLIFPDLNSGNISYKLVQRLAKAEAYGPILQGIAKPVNDLSRGCFADDIVGVVAITAVQAQEA